MAFSVEPFVGEQAASLLMWRNPVRSAGVLGAVTLAYLVLSWASIFMLVSRSLSLVIAAAWAWQHGGAMFGRTGPPVPALLTTGLSQEQFKPHADLVLHYLNVVLKMAGVIASGKDTKLSGQVVAGLMAGGWLLKHVSLLTLGYTVVLMSFAGPKLYELKQKEIDELVAIGLSKAKELYAKLGSALMQKLPQATAKKVH